MDVTHAYTTPGGSDVAARVIARTRELDAYFRMLGLTSHTNRAHALQVSERTVRRVMAGETHPSEPFIAATLQFFARRENGGLDFGHLFHVIDTDNTEPHLAPVSGAAA